MLSKEKTLEKINKFNLDSLDSHLEIEYIDYTETTITSRMPVNNKTRQPFGMLHGGASVALIESLGSVGSSLFIDLEKEFPVGIEVNANHVGSARSGYVVANATIIHKGKSTHVWTVEIKDEESSKLICTGRLTVMIIQKK